MKNNLTHNLLSKDEYKAIKAHWAKVVNNKDNHPTRDTEYGNKITGHIRAIHYVMYNAIRGVGLDRGFEGRLDFTLFDNNINLMSRLVSTLDTAHGLTYSFAQKNITHVLENTFGSTLDLVSFIMLWKEAVYHYGKRKQ